MSIAADVTVSVVILTKNAGPAFRLTLDRVCRQDWPGEVDVLILDSGSTDETLDIAGEFPVRVMTIEPGEFDHGHTRNLGVLSTTGEAIVFITQDAIPHDENWLAPLVRAVSHIGEAGTSKGGMDRGVAAAYSRVLPQPHASFHARLGVMRDLNARDESVIQGPITRAELAMMNPLDRRLVTNFNNVSSCIRRDVWESLPFARIRWGEDLFFGLSVIASGYSIAYVADSVVLHSHEYSLRTLYSRTRIDAETNKRVLDRDCVTSLGNALRLAGRISVDDWLELRREPVGVVQRLWLALRSPIFHAVEMLGLWRGGKVPYAEHRICPADRELRLRILYVVHSLPPYTLAGTEIYTLNLIRELRARHDVFVQRFPPGSPKVALLAARRVVEVGRQSKVGRSPEAV